MSPKTKGGTKKQKPARKYAQKYPESSGLNAAGHPVSSQLNNAEERPIVPPSRRLSQVMQVEGMPPQYYGHGEGPDLGHTFPGPVNAMYNSTFAPTSWDLTPVPFQPFPSAADHRQSTSPHIISNYDTYLIGQPSQPGPQLNPPPLTNIYHHPTEVERPVAEAFEHTTTHTASITGTDESILHQRRPLRFRAAPYPSPHTNNQITAQPTIAPYAQFRANVSESAGLTKLRPGELVRSVEFSTGIIRALGNSFRDVRKQSGSGMRLPPPPVPFEPAMLQAPISSEPGPSRLPLVSTTPAVTQRSPTVLRKNILDCARDKTKQYVLSTNAIPTRADLLSILKSAALTAIEDETTALEWFQTNEGDVKKLSDTASYIRSVFKDYAAHNVQDVFQLRETTALQNGLTSETEWKRMEHPLNPNSGSIYVSTQIINLVSDVLYLEDLHKHIDIRSNFVVTSTLAATSYYWALEQHAQGSFIPLDFVVERYTHTYMKIKAILSDVQSFAPFTQMVVRRGRSLLG
ncbi:hypothetical protein JVT61DRAFT_14881 [Boletus reticuloceps]|uniref:DUF6532 domain-containing protein n=1 Tax=Boletus reticuloceps TaxID=495285 RepID=A0A8I3A2U3_9AGAM|nr:hypothetical protein JVT61DRAFT_14881 [Boletus reticuloceps]